MPVTRFGGAEEEKLSGAAKPQLELLDALKTNRAIADFVVSELNNHFGSLDLSSKLGNPQAIHLSASWG
jgi:hypothetical protein